MEQGKIAFIDLKEFRVDFQIISAEMRRFFLGGRGINTSLLYKLVNPKMDSLSPDNPLIVGGGLLTGMTGPATARCSISGKSPETQLLGISNIGGHFGAALCQTGIYHLVLRGKAETPVYLLIEEGNINFKAAGNLWGKDSIETMYILKNLYGASSESLCIGQAGEALVRFAGIRHGWKNTAGRTGMGCLMGSKNIKAIVVKGKGIIPAAHPRELQEYVRNINVKLRKTNTRNVLHEYGTPFLYDLHNQAGVIRTHNGQQNKFEDGRCLSSAILKKKYYVEKKACFACPVACRHRYQIKEGRFKGVYGEGPEYGTLGAFGAICGIKDIESILAINDILNRYGLDSCSTGNIIAWAMELFQRGIINEKDTNGLNLSWGREETVIELIHQIARRDGFGALLADGARLSSARIGKGSERYLIWSKYLPQSDSVDVRAFKGFALGVATASRGADHLMSRPTMEALNLSGAMLRQIYGGAEEIASSQTSCQGKARMVWWSEINYALADALGLCRFVQKFNSIDHLGVEEFSRLIYLATDMKISPAELFETGERIVTLERLYLQREGITRKDDTLPDRYFDEPMTIGQFKGERLERDSFNKMLTEYYLLHGWDVDSGVPKKETLTTLGLADLCS
ncbi:MAG: aldehyde ferredoxin oxidoreductase family protein [Candidatus Schekmanbacteria bacterium]|nr:aldehyde ferredoxin oxidoreductase family protein [Candidatus Schekmanbacteria bacterium]